MALPTLVFVACGMLVAADVPVDTQKELDKLQGKWTIISQERDGKAVAAEPEATVTVTGDKFTTKAGDKTVRAGTLKLDPTKKPSAIDVTYTEGSMKDQTLQGVYTLEDGSWRILYSLPGKERPQRMANQSREGQMLLILKRLDK
jgi:uncharacterized protein (TIGR03067 family)